MGVVMRLCRLFSIKTKMSRVKTFLIEINITAGLMNKVHYCVVVYTLISQTQKILIVKRL